MNKESVGAFSPIKNYASSIRILVLSISVAYVVLFLTYGDFKQEMIEGLNARQMIHAKQAAKGIETFFNDYIEVLQNLARDEHLVLLDETGKMMMGEFLSSHPGEISIVTRIDDQGRILYPVPYDPAVVGQQVTQIEDFEEAKLTHKVVVSDVFTNRRGFKSIILHVPVLKEGSFDGTLAILLPFDFIAQRYIEDIRIGKDGYAWVISKNGIEISCPVPGHVGNSVFDNCREFPDILAMAQRMIRGEQGVATYTFDRLRGDVVSRTIKHAVFMPIRFGNTFWSIVVATPEDEVMASLHGLRNRLLLIAMLLIIGLGVFFYLIFRTRLAVQEMEQRKRTAEELDRYFTGSLDLLCIADTKGYFRKLNPEWERLLGYTIQELQDHPIMDLVHPDDREATLASVSDLSRQKEVLNFVNRYLCKDGTYRWLEWRSYPSGNQIYSVARDISDRKLAEEALSASEERYRTVFQNTGAATVIIEKNTIISLANTEFERLSGYTREELEGKRSWTEFVAPEDLERMIEQHFLRREAREKAARKYEFRFISRTGGIRNVYLAVDVIPGTDKSVASLIDITERKQAEEERVRLTTAIEQAAEAIIITDSKWTIEYVNPAFERMAGYCRDEIIGQHTRILKSEKHDKAFYKKVRETLVQGEVWSGRLTNKKKDGAHYEAEVTSSAVRDTQGKIINYVSIHRDITHEVRLEKELRQAQKMEAIGTLAGGIAHDFNNILAAIIGFSEMALLRVAQESPLRRNLEMVLHASSRASDLVKQILTFSRQAEQERKPMQVGYTVKETFKLLRSSLPSTIEIRQDLAFHSGKDLILGDPTQIQQVLMNLCTNAAHAMRDKGGILSVRVWDTLVDSSLGSNHHDLKRGPYVVLTVSDTGQGMDAVTMERIFDPYFTTKGIGEGTGLGLAVVQGIVKSYGGVITVSSRLEKGTTFDVFLPRIEEETLTEKTENGVLPTGSECVLFVDDEGALAELGREMLESLGYNVTAKTSSIEALETFRAQPDAFDLVITDMTMPDLTGRDLAGQLMAIRKDIPIILCTGLGEIMNGNQAREGGIREFVMKPYTITSFAQIIRNVLNSK
jgi:PAS domain S-box-containing protein